MDSDEHLYTVLRYVERNALRANLVERAEEWRWGSLWRRRQGGTEALAPLHAWSVVMPANWMELVTQPPSEQELEAVRRAVTRSCPYGSESWCKDTAGSWGCKRRYGAEVDHEKRPRRRRELFSESEPTESDRFEGAHNLASAVSIHRSIGPEHRTSQAISAAVLRTEARKRRRLPGDGTDERNSPLTADDWANCSKTLVPNRGVNMPAAGGALVLFPFDRLDAGVSSPPVRIRPKIPQGIPG